MTEKDKSSIQRQISLPLKQAFKISLRNITIRLGRALITAAGTMLGIAFLMSVLTGSVALKAIQVSPDPSANARQTWLVVMSLLVSTVGITNSMLMSVTERFREIGTMKCLGALDNFIVRIFLIESALLGFFGALVGGVVGMLGMLLVYWFKAGSAVFLKLGWGELLRDLLMAVLLGTVLSILAALPPALRAAKLPPAAALRTEI